MLSRADAALYAAKAGGRNAVDEARAVALRTA
jgi:PleD family two-component response regulator